MAVLKAELTNNLTSTLKQIITLFPDVAGNVLSYIGKQGRDILYSEFLSGQMLTLRKYPKNAANRPVIISDVNKSRRFVKIYSPSITLFERGRRLRSGQKEPGKYIITKHLRRVMAERLPRILLDYQ